jgi:hypothetical protein
LGVHKKDGLGEDGKAEDVEIEAEENEESPLIVGFCANELDGFFDIGFG